MSPAQCFYPNGDPSKENDIPCGSVSGVGCCPPGWACQVNGLCYLANQQYYGRYTCTDKSWKSPGCPQICTHNNTANGNEAVLQCSPGSFCCDTNRPELSGGQGCCDASIERFSIDGNVAMTVMSDAPAAATVTSNLAPTISASPSSQTTGSLSPMSIVVVTSVLNQGSEKTVTSMPSNSNSESHPAHTGAIVGGAIGGALVTAAIVIIAFLLLRRRQRRRNPPHVFRKFSLREDLDPMYQDRWSLKSLFKSDTPSELIGSVPDLQEVTGEKEWEKRYNSPGDVGKLLIPQHSARDLQQVSPLSPNFPDDHSEPAELPPQGRVELDAVYEMPERSNTRKPAR